MNEVIYILEDYDTGDMTGYWSKEAAKLDEVERLLDNIKEDFQTMLGEGHYIDCLMGMREVEIVK